MVISIVIYKQNSRPSNILNRIIQFQLKTISCNPVTPKPRIKDFILANARLFYFIEVAFSEVIYKYTKARDPYVITTCTNNFMSSQNMPYETLNANELIYTCTSKGEYFKKCCMKCLIQWEYYIFGIQMRANWAPVLVLLTHVSKQNYCILYVLQRYCLEQQHFSCYPIVTSQLQRYF